MNDESDLRGRRWQRLPSPLSLGLADRRAAQDKFKLGMAVGGNTCCEWMKAQGDVARALAEQRRLGLRRAQQQPRPGDGAQERRRSSSRKASTR